MIKRDAEHHVILDFKGAVHHGVDQAHLELLAKFYLHFFFAFSLVLLSPGISFDKKSVDELFIDLQVVEHDLSLFHDGPRFDLLYYLFVEEAQFEEANEYVEAVPGGAE